MNINLLSPTKNDNGFNYNVRFRENIKFKKNAKVYLNYATFSRESEVTFTEDQTITISDLQLLPELVLTLRLSVIMIYLLNLLLFLK